MATNGSTLALSEQGGLSSGPSNGVNNTTNPPSIPHTKTQTISQDIPNILPHERVFPIQIGSSLFKLSGASLSSDAPSYFSQYFLCQLSQATDPNQAVKTLYIDRDPVTFADIALHLQGYSIAPTNAQHFVRLFADAQFYNLPKLISHLFTTDIFITISSSEFRIPRDTFSSPGNTPNYFSLGFGAFFPNSNGSGEVFPGLHFEGLLRPPSIVPPSIPNRSAEIFAQILDLCRGYEVQIRGWEHRERLLSDARYYHLRGLEQRLVRCRVGWNGGRGRGEIVLGLGDVRRSGIEVVMMEAERKDGGADRDVKGYVGYKRPFVDEETRELVLEVGDEGTKLWHSFEGMGMGMGMEVELEFLEDTKARMKRLFEVIASKLESQHVASPQGQGNMASSKDKDLVKCRVGSSASVMLDGQEWTQPTSSTPEVNHPLVSGQSSTILHDKQESQPPTKRRRVDDSSTPSTHNDESTRPSWIIRTGLWRIGIRNGSEGLECVLEAVKIDAFSGERGRNARRRFLVD